MENILTSTTLPEIATLILLILSGIIIVVALINNLIYLIKN